MSRAAPPIAAEISAHLMNGPEFGWGLRQPLVAALLLGLISLVLIGIDGWWAVSRRTAQLDRAGHDAARLADWAAQQSDGIVDVANDVLLGTVERLQANGLSPAAVQQIGVSLAGRVAAFPRLYEIVVADENAVRLVSSRDDPLSGPDRQLAAVTALHRAHADPGVSIGVVQQSRRDGRSVMPISRRFDYPDGRFAGVVEALIDLNDFRSVFRRLASGPHGSVSLRREDGTLLVNEPLAADGSGAASPAFGLAETAAFRARSGMLEATVDGERRMYAFQHLERSPLILFYGVSVRDALAGWRVQTASQAVILALFLSLVWMAGWRVTRQSGQLRTAGGRLSAARWVLRGRGVHRGICSLRSNTSRRPQSNASAISPKRCSAPIWRIISTLTIGPRR